MPTHQTANSSSIFIFGDLQVLTRYVLEELCNAEGNCCEIRCIDLIAHLDQWSPNFSDCIPLLIKKIFVYTHSVISYLLISTAVLIYYEYYKPYAKTEIEKG